jgi:hypothetical protein
MFPMSADKRPELPTGDSYASVHGYVSGPVGHGPFRGHEGLETGAAPTYGARVARVETKSAACPPLKTTDVAEAADKLTGRTSSTSVIEHLLRHGGDLKNVQQVVEVLRALRDVRE